MSEAILARDAFAKQFSTHSVRCDGGQIEVHVLSEEAAAVLPLIFKFGQQRLPVMVTVGPRGLAASHQSELRRVCAWWTALDEAHDAIQGGQWSEALALLSKEQISWDAYLLAAPRVKSPKIAQAGQTPSPGKKYWEAYLLGTRRAKWLANAQRIVALRQKPAQLQFVFSWKRVRNKLERLLRMEVEAFAVRAATA